MKQIRNCQRYPCSDYSLLKGYWSLLHILQTSHREITTLIKVVTIKSNFEEYPTLYGYHSSPGEVC